MNEVLPKWKWKTVTHLANEVVSLNYVNIDLWLSLSQKDPLLWMKNVGQPWTLRLIKDIVEFFDLFFYMFLMQLLEWVDITILFKISKFNPSLIVRWVPRNHFLCLNGIAQAWMFPFMEVHLSFPCLLQSRVAFAGVCFREDWR